MAFVIRPQFDSSSEMDKYLEFRQADKRTEFKAVMEERKHVAVQRALDLASLKAKVNARSSNKNPLWYTEALRELK